MKAQSVKLAKKGALKAAPKKAAAGAGPVLDFVIQDNQDMTCTVLGVDAAGNTVDISGVATLTASSDDTAKITVDAPAGMSFTMHAVGPLTDPDKPVNLALTATWNDGSTGPFSFDLPGKVVNSPVSGVVVELGTPTAH